MFIASVACTTSNPYGFSWSPLVPEPPAHRYPIPDDVPSSSTFSGPEILKGSWISFVEVQHSAVWAQQSWLSDDTLVGQFWNRDQRLISYVAHGLETKVINSDSTDILLLSYRYQVKTVDRLFMNILPQIVPGQTRHCILEIKVRLRPPQMRRHCHDHTMPDLTEIPENSPILYHQ